MSISVTTGRVWLPEHPDARPALSVLWYLGRAIALIPAFLLVNFDRSENRDYGNYQDDWVSERMEFGPLYEAWLRVFRDGLGTNFESFWIASLVLEVGLLALLYRNWMLVVLAYPNIVYLAQGTLGTQIRFSVACIVLGLLVTRFSARGRIWLQGIFVLALHLGSIVGVGAYVAVRRFLKPSATILAKRNLFYLTVALAVFAAGLIARDVILANSPFDYYLQSERLETKSMVSIAYTALSLLYLVALASTRTVCEQRPLVYFSVLVLLFAAVFSGSAVIGGRYLQMYLFVEPFLILLALRLMPFHPIRALIAWGAVSMYLAKVAFFLSSSGAVT